MTLRKAGSAAVISSVLAVSLSLTARADMVLELTEGATTKTFTFAGVTSFSASIATLDVGNFATDFPGFTSISVNGTEFVDQSGSNLSESQITAVGGVGQTLTAVVKGFDFDLPVGSPLNVYSRLSGSVLGAGTVDMVGSVYLPPGTIASPNSGTPLGSTADITLTPGMVTANQSVSSPTIQVTRTPATATFEMDTTMVLTGSTSQTQVGATLFASVPEPRGLVGLFGLAAMAGLGFFFQRRRGVAA